MGHAPAASGLGDVYKSLFLPDCIPDGGETEKPYYFRIDRIRQITVHRDSIADAPPAFDEGLLRRRSLFMWSGELRTIRFEFTSPSVQAVLDKLLTARIIEREGKKCLIEAETYGNGIKMWRLSQGRWVKVVVPKDFVEEIKAEIDKMQIYTKNEETRFPFNRATVCSVDGV